MSYTPSVAEEEEPHEDDEDFWKEVKAQEDAYEQEDEMRKKAQAERQRSCWMTCRCP